MDISYLLLLIIINYLLFIYLLGPEAEGGGGQGHEPAKTELRNQQPNDCNQTTNTT